MVLILLSVVPAFGEDDLTQRLAKGFDETLEGLKTLGGLVVGGLVLAFFVGSGKRRPRTKKGGPLGGSHVAEAMILDKHYEDPVARHGARYIRDKFFS
ncbi:hypothetical protein [Magnetospirillum sp. UT-4]|uniref:hypothetical protein n=1 Tax=Magnetospirillum sp. UT-4 TaxID=2681467 RepID=UPI001574E3C1|nr:hypothetical protein [Magnetospirillum sp. UT-4]